MQNILLYALLCYIFKEKGMKIQGYEKIQLQLMDHFHW
jgi:hypothetical protein